MSKADFAQLRKPSRSPSTARRGKTKGGGKGERKEYRVNQDGKKEPRHCVSFLKTGSCQWEKDNPGKECNLLHDTKAQHDAKYEKLNP